MRDRNALIGTLSLSFFLSLSASGSGCGVGTEAPAGPPAQLMKEVIGGAADGDAHPGVVQLPGCSGVLIDSRNVLTAGHCVCTPDPADHRIDPRNCTERINVSLVHSGGNQLVTGSVSVPADFFVQLNTAETSILGQQMDLAMVALDTDAYATFAPIPVATASPCSGTGCDVEVVGFGRNVCDSGFGTRRNGTNSIQTGDVSTDLIRLREANGFITARGDSGGALLHNGVLIGTTSRGSCNDMTTTDVADYTNLYTYRSWITSMRNTLAHTYVSAFALSGNRIGAIRSTDNALVVKEGDLGSPWTVVHTNVKAFALWGNRIGVIRAADDALVVKEGGLGEPWTLVHNNVRAVALWGSRIGVIRAADNALVVKQGALGAPWTLVHSSAKAVALWSSRIGVIASDDSFLIKDGALGDPWTTVHTSAKAIALSDTRVGMIDGSDSFLIKPATLADPWTTVHTGAKAITLTDTRIGMIRLADNGLVVKDGALSAAWTMAFDNVAAFDMSGERIGTLRAADGSLIIKGDGY